MFAALAIAALCLASSPADPQPGAATASSPDAEANARARAHYDAAVALARLERWREALSELEAGYAESHLPAFLINMGQAYRHLGDSARAREAFERFLNETSPTDPRAGDVRRLIGELDAASPPSVTTPPISPPTESPPEVTDAAPMTEAPGAAVITPAPDGAAPDPSTTTQDPRTEIVEATPSWWWIVPVVTVAAAAVGVVAWRSRSEPQPSCAVTFGCIDLR